MAWRHADACKARHRAKREEFAAILPNTSETQALALAERLRSDIASLNVASLAHQRITASIGFAQRTGGIERWEEVLAFADRALYQAKEAGRNRSVKFVLSGVDVLNSYRARADEPSAGF